MGLILPSYMLGRKNFICSRCSFAFFKHTPSRVEKCPKCNMVVYDATYKKGDTLDKYSESKLRWYSEESGEKHLDEIRHRKLVMVDGKEMVAITDDKGRTIDYMPNFSAKDTEIGKKTGFGGLR